jgi:hypothetical protein
MENRHEPVASESLPSAEQEIAHYRLQIAAEAEAISRLRERLWHSLGLPAAPHSGHARGPATTGDF